jgi:hypothetical protein
MTHRKRSIPALAALAPLFVVVGCMPGDTSDDDAGARMADTTDATTTAAADPQDAFWDNLTELCGQAFAGEIAESAPEGTDADFAGREMVMHVRACEDDEIQIPFHVGEDRSRTWLITRTDDGLRLKHDHRHEDGSSDDLTMYGGDTEDDGTPTRQQFPADQETADMLPAAATNIWTVEVEPGQTFSYSLRREGTDRRFRVDFDLTEPVEAPPTPWGWD